MLLARSSHFLVLLFRICIRYTLVPGSGVLMLASTFIIETSSALQDEEEGILKMNVLTRILDGAGVNVMAAELSTTLPVSVLYLRSEGLRLLEVPLGTLTVEGNKLRLIFFCS